VSFARLLSIFRRKEVFLTADVFSFLLHISFLDHQIFFFIFFLHWLIERVSENQALLQRLQPVAIPLQFSPDTGFRR